MHFLPVLFLLPAVLAGPIRPKENDFDLCSDDENYELRLICEFCDAEGVTMDACCAGGDATHVCMDLVQRLMNADKDDKRGDDDDDDDDDDDTEVGEDEEENETTEDDGPYKKEANDKRYGAILSFPWERKTDMYPTWLFKHNKAKPNSLSQKRAPEKRVPKTPELQGPEKRYGASLGFPWSVRYSGRTYTYPWHKRSDNKFAPPEYEPETYDDDSDVDGDVKRKRYGVLMKFPWEQNNARYGSSLKYSFGKRYGSSMRFPWGRPQKRYGSLLKFPWEY